MIHVMVDLETASTANNAAILSLGACCFAGRNPHSDSRFYMKASLASNEAIGLNVDKEVMEWWDKQSPHSRAEAFSGTEDVLSVLDHFHSWICKLGPIENVHLWGNGADFDLVILRNAYETNATYPFDFRKHRCYRTISSIFASFIPYPKYAEQQHNALADAEHQAKRISHLVNIGKISI